MTGSNLIDLIRTDIEDFALAGNEIRQYTSSNIFTLWEDKVDSSSITIYINGIQTSNYTYNTGNITVTINDSLEEGDVVQITYTYYANYSDSMLKKYIKAALIRINLWYEKVFEVLNNEVDFEIIDTELSGVEISERDYCLTSLVTSILIKPDWAQYKALDVTINFKNSLSKEEKIQQVINDFMRDKTGQMIVLDEEIDDES